MKKSLMSRLVQPVLMFMKISAIVSPVFILLCSFGPLDSSFGQKILNKPITFTCEKATFSEALDKIAGEGVKIIYAGSIPAEKAELSFHVRKESLRSVLDKLLPRYNLTYTVVGNNIVLKGAPSGGSDEAADFEQNTVTGKVIDENKQPVIGATVQVKGTSKGVSTNASGEFTISAKTGDILIVKYLGYAPQEIAVRQNTAGLTIELVPDRTQLQEVVVTALGIKREEKSLGYAVQKVTGKDLQTIKGVDVRTSLTGKVAGLQVLNSTEFFEAPNISLRGASPLIIIDGVPYGNMSFRDVRQDDIESIDILKGATASALYGARGGNGAIMITTKKGGSKNGLEIMVNSNTMVDAGFLAFPEVQTAYSSGYDGKYNTDDYVWGDKLDIGRRAMQWDPITKSMQDMELTSRGKNNFRNFLQNSFITNNNISVAQRGENGSFRASASNIYNQGQYPNTTLRQWTFNLGGEMKLSDKFSMDATMGYNKRSAPNTAGTGYGNQGYIYNILVWTGPEYDLTQYRDYWVTPDVKQNWHYSNWYDNPYMMAYEKLNGVDQNVFNGSVSAKYKIKPWLSAFFRSGIDYYINENERRNPLDVHSTRGWNAKGMYQLQRTNGYSLNNDLMLMFDKSFLKDFRVEGILGGAVYFYQDESLLAETRNGLSIPGFYSLRGSVEPATISSSTFRKQVNGLYGKATLSYKSLLYWDITGRNDWSSTLPASTRSYFYPSTGISLITSELFKAPAWLDFWKVRASWTLSKSDLGVYATNQTYSSSVGVWNGLNSASYPTSLAGANLEPVTNRTYEFGTAANFFKNRLRADLTYYNKYTYNRAIRADISNTSGFTSKLTNIDETIERKGFEVSLGGSIIKNDNLQWDAGVNWSASHSYYKNLDPVYSADKPWIKPGGRTDAYITSDWDRDPQGNIIHNNGFPVESDYDSQVGYADPSWIWGLNNTLTYKNLSLGLSFDGRFGGLSYSGTNANLWVTGRHIDSDNDYRYQEVVNGKQTFIGNGVRVVSGTVQRDKYGNVIPGTDTRVFARNDQVVSYEGYMYDYARGSQNIWDETFLKLREVSLTYQIPSRLAQKGGMKNASIGIVGQNVLLLTKEYRFSDPDKASDDLNSPSVRYLGANLKFTF